jgi:hypothetical protein
MSNRLVSFVALIAATGAIVALRRSSRARSSLASDRAAPTPVQTWEGEGGALPATGAQMGPDPALVGATDDDIRRDNVITGIH